MHYTTKDRILDAAYKLCQSEYGAFANLNRTAVADEAGVNTALVNYWWGNGLVRIKTEIVKRAVRDKQYHIINTAVACGMPYALSLPRELRERAAIEVLG